MLIFAIIIYFIATLSVGVYASKKIQSVSDFINAGRNLHPAINTAALFALWFGSETIFGASAEFANHGFIGVIEDPLGGVLCLLFVGLFFAKKLYQMNMLTLGDLFRNRYGVKIEIFSSILMVLSFLGYVAAQIVALGLLTKSLLGLDLTISMILSLAIVVIYTFKGGMWAVSLTDFIQSILIVVGLIAMVLFSTEMAGGYSAIIGAVSPHQLQFFPENSTVEWINWVAAWMALGFGSIASQDIFQRVNSARSADAAHKSTIAAAALYLLLSLLPLYLITAVKIIDPSILNGDLQSALPQLVLKTMPLWIQILFFGSLLSAIMSTCSGGLLAPASLISENILKPMFFKNITDKQLLHLTRFSVLIVGIIALLIAVKSKNIFNLVSEASVIGLVTIFTCFIATFFYGHSNRISALFSMILGTSVYVLFNFYLASSINPSILGLGGSILGLGLGQMFSHLPFLKNKAYINT